MTPDDIIELSRQMGPALWSATKERAHSDLVIKQLAVKAGFEQYDQFPPDYQDKIKRLVEQVTQECVAQCQQIQYAYELERDPGLNILLKRLDNLFLTDW